MTRLTCLATKYGNNHHSRTRLLIIDTKYTIFVHCHNLTGAATGVERYKLVSNFKEFLYFKSFYIFDFLLIKCVFSSRNPGEIMENFKIVNETIIEERNTEVVENFVHDT